MFGSSEDLCTQDTGTSMATSDPPWTPGSSQEDSQPNRKIDGEQLFLVTFAAIQSLFS